MRCALLLVVVCTALVLTGCGASRATKPTGPTLAADIRADPFVDGHLTSVRCTRHACALTVNDRVFDARSAWLGVLGQVATLEGDAPSIRYLRITVTDPRSRRIAYFRCVLDHDMSPGSRPWHPCRERLHEPA